MTDNALISWSVLIPVKVLSEAKSRLAGLAGPRRGELALAVACDTVTAVMRTDQAARAIVITDDPVAASALRELGAQVIPDEPRDGLNAALRHGAAHAAARWPGSGTAALSADLPALRPEQIGRALRSAAAWPTARRTCPIRSYRSGMPSASLIRPISVISWKPCASDRILPRRTITWPLSSFIRNGSKRLSSNLHSRWRSSLSTLKRKMD